LWRGRLPVDLGPPPPGVDRNMVERWSTALRRLDVDGLIEHHRSLDIALLSPSESSWPFTEDPDPPVLLFYRGDLQLLDASVAAAVVGTRRCTSVGRTVAYEMGRGLAIAGVVVVSGLALGIDGAAHRGALDQRGPVIGVVGSGLDVVYPGANRGLWDEVAERGLLISEAPAGARPERWRFPARNRLIAGLSDGVVIIESHDRGGALLTVDEAVDRGRPVFAVPGSVLSPASDGTNELLVEGAIPVRSAADVVGHLGIPSQPRPASDADTSGLSTLAATILAETATGPVHLDRLLLEAGAETAEVLAEVQALVAAGRLILDGSTVSRP
ncbi:MAG: DNA-processing protein DprA, partial [Acidimicrobiales bacterium]